jgi:hypothetical protein
MDMKKLVVIGFLFIFVSVAFSGCEELDELNKPNYIIVNVVASATVYTVTETLDTLTPDINVMFEIVKAQGERFEFYRLTTSSGSTESVSCSFNLYKEQFIRSYAQPTGVPTGAAKDMKALNWETVSSAAKMGESYTWNINHLLYISSSG